MDPLVSTLQLVPLVCTVCSLGPPPSFDVGKFTEIPLLLPAIPVVATGGYQGGYTGERGFLAEVRVAEIQGHMVGQRIASCGGGQVT